MMFASTLLLLLLAQAPPAPADFGQWERWELIG